MFDSRNLSQETVIHEETQILHWRSS